MTSLAASNDEARSRLESLSLSGASLAATRGAAPSYADSGKSDDGTS